MSNDINEILLKTVVDKMWSIIGQEEFKGLTPYQVARKLGLNHNGAKIVETLWDGPKTF